MLSPATLLASAFEVSDGSWEGASELYAVAQRELGKDRVEVLAALDYERLAKEDGLLILHPERELEYDELSAFLRAGGRLAVLDDRGRADRFLTRFQIQRVEAPRSPAQALRDNPELAIAVPAVEQVAGQEQNRHPVVSGVERVVTNHPTALTHPNLTPVLKIPALGEPDATIAVTGIIAKSGRLFAMGDPSVLINEMLRYPGNRALAVGLVKYLVENDAGMSRGGKLYIVANGFRQRGQFGGARGALSELSSFSDAIRSFGADLEAHGLPPAASLVLALLCVAGALGWVATHSARLYRRLLPRYALPSPLFAQGGLAGRAALLSQPGTDPALLLLELRAGMNEALCLALDLPRLSSAERVVTELRQRASLDASRVSEIAALYRRLGEAQAALLARTRLRVSLARTQKLTQQTLGVIAEAEELRRRGTKSKPS